MPAVCLDSAKLIYSAHNGVKDISFSIEPGSVLGLLGANGAGKTTVCRLLMGLVKADAGSVQILGKDAFSCHAALARDVAYVAGEVALDTHEKALSKLSYVAALYGMDKKSARTRIVDLAERLDLDLGLSISNMSKGNKQKVALIEAFMRRPKVLILDEPSSGLDPLMQARLIELIEEMRQSGSAILLSSHIFEEVEKCAESVCFLKDGRVALYDSAAHIRDVRLRHFSLELEDAAHVAALLEDLRKRAWAMQLEQRANATLSFDMQGSAKPLMELAKGYPIKDIYIENASLEEMFLDLYSKEQYGA